MPETVISETSFCRQCHARVFAGAKVSTCPACGGLLLVSTGALFESPNAPPAQIDHRGIVLPPRHAVGGVITPR